MTRQAIQITTTAPGAANRTYDKVLKRFSDDGKDFSPDGFTRLR